MLPAAYRLTRRQDFTVVVRRGRRAGRRRLVVHALIDADLGRAPMSPQDATRPGDNSAVIGVTGDPSDDMTPTPTRAAAPPRVGFVVSKAVGNSVVRHRVTRRLRHLMRDRLAGLPSGSSVVVRALGPAATASSAELGADLDAALRRLADRPPAAGASR